MKILRNETIDFIKIIVVFFVDEILMIFFCIFFDIKRYLKKYFYDFLMYNFLKKDLFKSILEILL